MKCSNGEKEIRNKEKGPKTKSLLVPLFGFRAILNHLKPVTTKVKMVGGQVAELSRASRASNLYLKNWYKNF